MGSLFYLVLMMRIFFIILFTGIFYFGNAQKVDTVYIFSHAMHKALPCVVIKPSNYSRKKTNYPVVYLLHGHSGSYSNWIIKMPSLKYYASLLNIIIVCPEGGYSSWYADSPIDSSIRFETFISKELILFIDKNYRTIADKKHRAITGLSMGGHGAIMLAMRHLQTFGAAASISGIMDLNDIKTKYEAVKSLGDTSLYADYWKKYSVYNIADTLKNGALKLLIDCGTKDILINSNRA